jgi:hypothetical protein
MIVITKNSVKTDSDGYVVHRIGSDIYAKAMTRTLNDSEQDYEEVEATAIPQDTTEAEELRRERIVAAIRSRYSIDDEIAIIRQKDVDEAHRLEFEAYFSFAEQCKAEAKDTTE